MLYNFGGGTDGAYPYTGVVLDKEGNLYGTTWVGGDLSCAEFVGYGCGTVFKRDPTGKFTVPYNFTGGADGALLALRCWTRTATSTATLVMAAT